MTYPPGVPPPGCLPGTLAAVGAVIVWGSLLWVAVALWNEWVR